jgi:photosystem II stability/assembly factor-like uncharacterized protein
MGKHRQAAITSLAPSLAGLALAGLLGGCAVASSGQPTGPGRGSAAAARCPAGGAGSGAMGSGGTWSGAAPLQAMQFTRDGHGWVAGAGRILATDDGGRTWSARYTGPAAIGQLDFTGTSDGWAVGPGALLRTTDGGASWTPLGEPRVNGHCLSVSSVHFVSPALGYAIAGPAGAGHAQAASAAAGRPAGSGGGAGGSAGAPGGQLLRSTDGGVTWQLAAGAPDGAQAVCFSTAQDGYLGVPGRIWRTTDAGASWSPAFTEPPASSGQRAGAAGDTPELGCAAHGAAWALFLGSGAAMMHAPYLAYATQDGSSWHGVLEEPLLESAMRPRLHLPAGPGSEPGPFSVISPGAAAFVGYTPPANGWGAAPLVVATHGGAVLKSAGDIPAINEPLAAAFVTPARGWVAGENLKTHTFSVEATTDAGRRWTTQYTTG